MPCIREACQTYNVDFTVLASHLGTPVVLLEKMDDIAIRLPEDLRERIESYVNMRSAMVEEFIRNLDQWLAQMSDTKSPLIFVTYDTEEDFQKSGEDTVHLTAVTHKDTIAALARKVKDKGVEIKTVPFNKSSYDAWRGDIKDSGACRSLWAAARLAGKA